MKIIEFSRIDAPVFAALIIILFSPLMTARAETRMPNTTNRDYMIETDQKRESIVRSRQDGHEVSRERDEYHHAVPGDGSDLDISLEAIKAATCEHGTNTIDCGSCRFEVGVVKVDPLLIIDKSEPGGGGLLMVEKAAVRRVGTTLNTTGEVVVNENRTVHVRSRLTGIVREVHADYGDEISVGDPLATIDSIELGETVADLLKAHASMGLAEQTFEREEALYNRGVSSEKEMLEVRAEFEKAKIDVESFKRKLSLFGLEKTKIEGITGERITVDPGLMTINAQSDGVVIAMHVVRGEFITPENEIFTVTDINSLWVWADIYERDLANLLAARSIGKVKAEVSVEAFQGRSFEGEVDYIAAVSDEFTRTVKVRIEIDNSERLLRPGMFCLITIYTSEDREALILPEDSLLGDEGELFVFKKLEDDFFLRRRIITGERFGSYVEIKGGVAPGDQIVTKGAFILKSDVLRAKMGAGCAD